MPQEVNKIFLLIILSSYLLIGCDQTYTPRPKGYFKITVPEKSYQQFDEPGFPYAFEYPVYGKIMQDSTFFDTIPENPYWINIDFPEFHSKIYISYKPINASEKFDVLIRDAFKMTSKHSIKASYIDEIPFKGKEDVGGMIFDVGGNAATGKQFFATDSIQHFLRGALYFEAVPNYDSIQPVEKFLYQDVVHLLYKHYDGKNNTPLIMSSLHITLVQTDLHWENKTANLKMLDESLQELSQPNHLIILPEMFTTGFSMRPSKLAEKMNGDTMEWMRKLSKEKKSILTGSVIIEEKDANGVQRYFNRMIWMMPNGHYGFYDKRHLFGFAEEDKHYVPGDKRIIFSVNGWKILPQICYDLRFPVWSRQQLIRTEDACSPEYDVIIYIANWPEKRKHAWRSLLIARAIENQCYVVAVNRVGTDGKNNAYSGNSMVVDPLGEIIFEKENMACVQQIEISKSHLETCRSKFPFLRDADDFQLFKD